MKQLLQDMSSHTLEVKEVPPPQCAAGGVLVKNMASMISSGTERTAIRLGSKTLLGKAIERPDLVQHVFRRMMSAGVADVAATVRARLEVDIALGYSSAGVVLEAGDGANEFVPGQRVACAGMGHASHAEVNWVPRNLCVGIPLEVDFESASSVAIGAIALQGVRLAEAKIGERVAVIGLGLVGLLSVQILKAAGCSVWGIDPDPERASLALELGADFACPNREWKENPWNRAHDRCGGADAVIIAAGTRSNEPIVLAGNIARDCAIVVIVGDIRVDIPREHFYKKELLVRYSRSYGPGRYDSRYEEDGVDYPAGYVRWTEKSNMEAYLQLVAQGKVDVRRLITHRFDIKDATEAYSLLSATKGKYIAMVLTYPGVEADSVPKRVAVRGPTVRTRKASPSQAVARVGWIGAGGFSRARLLPALRRIKNVDLIGLANATGVSARKAAERFGFDYCTTDANELLDDPSINTIFIATRHHLHAPLVSAALERGKNVFVEKPLCVNEEELDGIVKAYRAADSVLTVGFNRRFSPFARGCRKFFEGLAEPLSILYRVNAGRLPGTHWIYDPQQGHGRVIGEICHFVDMIQFLASSDPVEVQAWPMGGTGGDAEDNLQVRVVLADGSCGDILYLSSGDSSVPKERVEVFGRERTAVCDDYKRSWFYRDSRSRSKSLFRQNKGHQEELQAFIDALTRDGKAPIPFGSLVLTTRTTFCIRESFRSGHAVKV
ncbi:MAG: bi-domain-containing oxidoreductase [Acidobacteriota bacterium]